MRVNVNNYDEARSLLEDPAVAADPELGPALRDEVKLYETSQQVGGVFNTFAGPTGLQALDETGLFPAAEQDDKLVSQQDKFVQKGARPVAKAAAGAVEKIREAPLPADVIEQSNEQLIGDPVQDSLMNIERMDRDMEKTLGLADRDETLTSASKLQKLYRDPEFMPEGKSFWDYAQATYHYEPPVDMVREALKEKYIRDGFDEGAADERVKGISESSDEYQRFADALWVETYEAAKAAGKPALRTEYMHSGGWRTQAQALGVAAPVAYGVDRSLTGGLATEAVSGVIESEPNRRARQAEVEASPIATGAGAVVGALAPGGLVGRTYGTMAGRFVQPGMGLGSRLMGQAAAGAGTGAVESLASDAVHNLSELAFTDAPRIRSEGDVAQRLGLSALAGAGGGVGGELIASGGGALVRRARRGKLGPTLRRAEEGGATTSFLRGAEMTPAMKADEAYAIQHKVDPEDLMVQNVADPIAARALREQNELAAMQAAENALVGPGTKLGKKEHPLQPVVEQVRKELGDLFDKTGRLDPAAAKERKELGQLAAEIYEVRMIPATGRASPGHKRISQTELGKLLDQAPELVPMVRQAQRDALDPFVAKKGRGRKKTAKQALSPEPADIGGASTVRDTSDTMLPPPTEKGTMRSPPFTARGEKPPNVNVEEPDPGDLLGETEIAGQKVYVPGEVKDHVYVIGPRKMDRHRLDRFEKRVNRLVEDSGGHGPYKRIEAAVLANRDKFDFPGAEPMRKGDLRLQGQSAKKAEHQMQLEQLRNKQEMAGLPRRDLKPMPEYEAGAGEPALPILTGAERQMLTGAIGRHGAGGRPEADVAQVRLAEEAGVLPELKQLVSYKAVKDLQKAASFKAAVGSRFMPSLYSGQPFSTIGLRVDPMLRALAGDAPKATRISEALYTLVKRVAGGGSRKNPAVETSRSTGETVSALRASRLNPLATIQGAASRGSARRLAPAVAGGEDQKRGYKLSDLSPEEVRVLLRLTEVVQKQEPRQAASGE